MATPDVPVETIVGNLAEEALIHYWKDQEAKQPSPKDKYFEKYASKNCPYRQKFVRPTIALSTLLSTVHSEKKHTVTRLITPTEYEQLATKTHVQSKTSPTNPNSLLHYTKGEVILPRWPENKIKIVRDPTVSPHLPANPENSYQVYSRPQSPSPSERHSWKVTSNGRPKSKNGRNRSPVVPSGFAQYSELIQDLQAKLTDEEQQAIDRIQQSLLAATKDFEQMTKSNSRNSSPKNCTRPQSRDQKLNSVRNNLNDSFNGAVGAAATTTATASGSHETKSRPNTAAKLSPIVSKVRQHYNIMEEFLDLSSSNDILMIDGDFDLDFRNDWETNSASTNGNSRGGAKNNTSGSRPLSSVDRNGYQKLALPDFDLNHNRHHYLQQQRQWSEYASDIIAQNTQRFNSMHHPQNSSNGNGGGSGNNGQNGHTREENQMILPTIGQPLESSTHELSENPTAAAAAAPHSLSSAGRVIPNLVVMINDPLDLAEHAAAAAAATPSEGHSSSHNHSHRTLVKHPSCRGGSPKHHSAGSAATPSSAAAAGAGAEGSSSTPLHRLGSHRLGSGTKRGSVSGSGGGGSGSRRPSLENARRPSLENNKMSPTTPSSDARRTARRSLDNALVTSAATPKPETGVRPVRPHSASRSSPPYTAAAAGGRRRSSLSHGGAGPPALGSGGGDRTSPQGDRAPSPSSRPSSGGRGLTRQTPRELRSKKKSQMSMQRPDSPGSDPDAVKEGEDEARPRSHHRYHRFEGNNDEEDSDFEYIDATDRAPNLNPSTFQTSARAGRKKRHNTDLPLDSNHSFTQAELDLRQEEEARRLAEGSTDETPLEALFSVSQQVMQAVSSLNAANPVVIKPKHLHVTDPYTAGTHDEPGDVVLISPLHATSHPGRANMLNMFSEMKMKTLKKVGSPVSLKLATVASAAKTSAAASRALTPQHSEPPPVNHLHAYNEFCFDVAKLGIEFISMRDVSMTQAIGRGKFAAVYEAQLRTLAKNPNNGVPSNSNSTSNLFIGPISIHHRSYNEHTETVALKIAQFEGNDPYFTPHGGTSVSAEDTSEGHALSPSAGASKAPSLPPLSSIVEFQRELHALRELAGHKNMVKVRGISISPLAIALELVEFGNLHANMAKEEWQEETTLRDRISYMLDVCDGLGHMHARLFVHRDIKPHNILLGTSPTGQTICKIADLGTAVKLKDVSELLTEQIGTTGYSAPEIFSTRGYSFPVDVFASAVLFWELLGTTRAMRDNILMGHDPSEAVEMMESGVRPVFHTASDYHSRPELRAAIERAWSTLPEDRPVVTALRASVAACPPI